MSQPQNHIKVFIAYAREDEKYLNRLRVYLSPLERNQTIKIWYDGEIVPGSVWEESIKTHIHSANIILLLVSADSLASDYFYNQEMSDALKRHEKGDAIVVPVILRDCNWELTQLRPLQALPKDAKPISLWNEPDAAYASVVRGLDKCIAIARSRKGNVISNVDLKNIMDDIDSEIESDLLLQNTGNQVNEKLLLAKENLNSHADKRARELVDEVLVLEPDNEEANKMLSTLKYRESQDNWVAVAAVLLIIIFILVLLSSAFPF